LTATRSSPDAYVEKHTLYVLQQKGMGAVREVVGIWRGAFSGNMKVSFQAARSIG
jgi:hypothetical protein